MNLGRPIAVRTTLRTVRLTEVCTRAMLEDVMAVATDHSMYAAAARMLAGYLPYRGGIRIGVAGTYAMAGERVHSLSGVTGLVIRLPRVVAGCSGALPLSRVWGRNVLIVSPPFGGKTTFLRDLATRLSEEGNVVVVDERGELGGQGALYVGDCLLVSGAPKREVMGGIVRAMNPRYVVMDELDPAFETDAVRVLAGQGVNVVATLHGDSLTHLPQGLIDVFGVRVRLASDPGPGRVAEVRYD